MCGDALKDRGHSGALDIHLGLNPTFPPESHANGKLNKMIFCRKGSLLTPPHPNPPHPLPFQTWWQASESVAKQEDLTGAFVNLQA